MQACLTPAATNLLAVKVGLDKSDTANVDEIMAMTVVGDFGCNIFAALEVNKVSA